MAPPTEPFVLIVEDNPDDAELIQAVFEARLAQAKTHRVVSGWEARSYLAGESPFEDRRWNPLPSLVVLDLGLPDESGVEAGFEILAWLAEQEGISQIPVIVFTGYDDPEHARRAQELGARRFLRKDDGYEELTEAIEEELRRLVETQEGEPGS